jgi:beta-carotene 15,15'-dioxygenase
MGGFAASGTQGADAFRERVLRDGPLAVLIGGATAAAVWGSGWTAAWGAWPWVVSLVFVGLPHGAADFTVSRTAWRGVPLVVVWLCYLVAMAAVGCCFVATPAITLALFAIASCWHFGVAHLDTDVRYRHRGQRPIRALARGCGVLAVPLVAWPAATAAAASELASFAIGSDAAMGLFPFRAVMTAGVCLAVIGGIALLAEVLSERSRVDGQRLLRRLVLEVAAIVALGWFADPLFSVGLYFLVWHAWRQMEPLAESLSAPPFCSWLNLATGLTRVHFASLPLLLPSLVAIGAAWWAWAPDHTLRSLAIASIGGYLIVTPAHELLAELLRVPAIRPTLARLARRPAVRHAA